jgi:Domain of unknown function (DUF4118)
MSASVPSWWLRPHPVSNYAIAVLSVAAAVVVDLVFDRLTGADPSISLFLCAIMLVAWASGTGPALLATALTIPAYDYFFLRPEYSASHRTACRKRKKGRRRHATGPFCLHLARSAWGEAASGNPTWPGRGDDRGPGDSTLAT